MTARRLAVLALAVAVPAAAFLAWRLARAPPDDEEQVRRIFAEAARAAEEKRVSDAVERVSEGFQGQGLDKRGLKQLIAFHALRGEWNAVVLLGMRVRVEGDGASATADAALLRGGRGERIADRLPADASVYRVDAELRRERGGWWVVAARWRPIEAAEALAGPPPWRPGEGPAPLSR
jgi:hypothetical protein